MTPSSPADRQLVAVLRERQELLERLSRIQRSISHGAPLDAILTSITAGAHELLGDEIVGLRLVDPGDPQHMVIASGVGLTPEVEAAVRHGSVGSGAGGRAISEGHLVVIEDYQSAANRIGPIADLGVHAAMAAPVREGVEIVGSLVVASLQEERRYSESEQEVLLAFAEHTSLALTDAQVIHERERLARRHTEERFLSLVRHSTDLIMLADREGNLRYQTPSVSRLLGFAPRNVLGEEALHPADRDRAIEAYHTAVNTPGTTGPLVVRFRSHDGGWRDVELVATNLLDDPNVGGVVLNARDVTDRRRTEQALRASEQRYRTIVETSNDGVWVLDDDSRTAFVNAALSRMLGYSAEELHGRHPWEFTPHSEVASNRAAMQRRASGRSDSYETVLRHRDGHDVHVLISGSPTYGQDGTFNGSVAVVSDLSTLDRAREEKLDLEQRLQRAQSLETIGDLTRQIAHDFKNLLGVILGYATLMRDEMRKGGDAALEDVEAILQAAGHGDVLTRQLLAYSRRDAVRAEPLDLNDVVRDSLRLVRGTTPDGVTVEAHLAPDPLLVRTEAPALTQVVLNLVGNAFDAMPGGGAVVVTTRATQFAPAGRGRVEPRGGRYAVLTVADAGSGMQPEVAARALEPMFTTKPLGEGTGLGLSIVHGVVQQTGGHVEIHSSPGRGTTIEVLLPLTADARVPAPPVVGEPDGATRAAEADATTGAAPQAPHATILLVEDDDAVRDLTRRVLEAAGYTVVAAASAEEALSLDQDPAVTFDLVLTDNAMTRMSGIELLRRMGTASRGLPAIVMSGYVAEPATEDRTETTIAWLQKPFDASTLLDAVRAALQE